MRYRVYSLDGSRLIGSDEIEAANDVQAARIARQRGSGDHVEIWNDGRRVRVIAPRKADLASSA